MSRKHFLIYYLYKSMDKYLINFLLIMMTTVPVECISERHNPSNIKEINEESFTTSTIFETQSTMTLSKTTTPTLISDLQVAAHLQTNNQKSIQLKINWKTSNINETTYNIIVRPQKSIHDDCPLKVCEEYGLFLNSSEFYMPRDPMPMLEHRECPIEAGCTYLIQISSSNSKQILNTSYSVPECVGIFCSCRHRELLPNISISGEIDFTLNRLLFSWNVTTPNIHSTRTSLHSVNIELKINQNPSIPHLVEEVMNQEFSLIDSDGNLKLDGNSTYDFPTELKPGSRVLLRGHTIDTSECTGLDGNLELSIPDEKYDSQLANEENLKHSLAIVLIIAATLALLLFSVIIIAYIRRKREIKNFGKWSKVYHSVPNSGVHISMQENSLYVDKEILEARDRGEADQMEISHHCVTIGREIGKGAFGRVFIARADHIHGKPGSQIVAVKQLKKRPNPDELEEFLWEIATMKKVGKHPNVVTLLGCCTIKQPLLMVMEYVGCGDLLQYLRHVRARHEARSAVVSGIMRQCSTLTTTTTIDQQNSQTDLNSSNGPLGKYIDLLHNSSNSDASYITQPDSIPSGLRPSVTETLYTMLSQNPDLTATSNSSSLEYVLDHKELHSFALQIAYGMKHLESKQITHRDLATRNILIDENKTLKISDFGLSRTGIYVNTRNKKVPLRWLSIEAMRDNLYSSKSDIWAFGIVLWEIGTLGGFPYPTVGNHELLLYLLSGQRLQRPENCSQLLYDIMLQCWAEHPEDRFSFSELVNKLTQQKIYIDFDELGPNYVFPPTIEQTKNQINVNGGFSIKN